MLWKIIFVLEIFCFLYYALIFGVTKKWNSTFSRFWILAGICFLLLGKLKPERAVYPLLIFSLIFLLTECRILFGMVPSHKKNLPYLIVLGAQVRGKRLSSSLYRRIERARLYLADNPETVVIVSGGQGEGEEITEASAMRQYLLGKGIEEKRIFMEGCSTTTAENLKFSAEYIHDLDIPVGIVTNNFHMYRACCYARRIGYQNLEAVPAGCPPVFFINYMVREFFALVKMMLMGTGFF